MDVVYALKRQGRTLYGFVGLLACWSNLNLWLTEYWWPFPWFSSSCCWIWPGDDEGRHGTVDMIHSNSVSSPGPAPCVMFHLSGGWVSLPHLTSVDMIKRKTVTTMDVVYALKRKGRTLYGFGGWECTKITLSFTHILVILSKSMSRSKAINVYLQFLVSFLVRFTRMLS